MNYINELREAIRKIHGVETTHVSSVPVKETFQGKTVWEGILATKVASHGKYPVEFFLPRVLLSDNFQNESCRLAEEPD